MNLPITPKCFLNLLSNPLLFNQPLTHLAFGLFGGNSCHPPTSCLTFSPCFIFSWQVAMLWILHAGLSICSFPFFFCFEEATPGMLSLAFLLFPTEFQILPFCYSHAQCISPRPRIPLERKCCFLRYNRHWCPELSYGVDYTMFFFLLLSRAHLAVHGGHVILTKWIYEVRKIWTERRENIWQEQ